ncbi:MAG TPA: hypothetical protein VHA52_08620, partial [Candidatus Babeliaceae bacterium]|nr:hypothetical protein [Candidatus Babeliaceae bacterium]
DLLSIMADQLIPVIQAIFSKAYGNPELPEDGNSIKCVGNIPEICQNIAMCLFGSYLHEPCASGLDGYKLARSERALRELCNLKLITAPIE